MKKSNSNPTETPKTSRKPWVEPEIIFEQPLEARADGPLGKDPYTSSFLGPLYASQNSGVCL